MLLMNASAWAFPSPVRYKKQILVMDHPPRAADATPLGPVQE
jgi:hypothetical protein